MLAQPFGKQIDYSFATYKKFLVILLSIVLILGLSMTAMAEFTQSVIIPSSGSISSISPLHVEGKYIKNNADEVVTLTGTNYAYFLDDPNGSWVLPSGAIKWSVWDPVAAEQNLEAMNSWGCNVVRDYTTVEWWIDDTSNFHGHIKEWIQMAAENEIYIIFSFWRNNGTEGIVNMPYFDQGNGYINTQEDFVNLWVDVAQELKNYPNVIFELWNEPVGNTTMRDSWMDTTQQCITAIREVGATNIILAQWAYAIGVDFGWTPSKSTLDWVTNYPLVDPLGNIAYSTHIYRTDFYNSQNGFSLVYNLSDVSWALNLTQVYSVAQQHPLIIGEIGASNWWSKNSTEFAYEMAWFNNTLSLLNQNGVGYCAFWWWSLGKFQLFYSSNYTATQAGIILKNAIGNSTNYVP